MSEQVEYLSDRVWIARHQISPRLAASAGKGVVELFEMADDGDEFWTDRSTATGGVRQLILPYLDPSEYADDPDYVDHLARQTSALDRALDRRRTKAIATLLSDALQLTNDGEFQLTNNGVHYSSPGAEFSAHFDAAAGVNYSLALSPGEFRLHNGAHEVITTRRLKPGDEVAIENGADVQDRPIHSFRTIAGLPRTSLTSKYYDLEQLEAYLDLLEEIGDEGIDRLQQTPIM